MPECPYHYTVCYTHIEQNKAHPLIGFPNKWLATVQSEDPTVSSVSKETIMLLPDPDPLVPLACLLNPQAQTVASPLAGAVAEAAKSYPQLALEVFTSFMVPEKNIPTTLDLKPSVLDSLLSQDVK